MKNKRKLFAFIAALSCALIVIGSSSFMSSGSKYNDVAYRSYLNLSENSDVPSLFKNDSVYNSYKKYPPVISNGIEYVPLEMFYGLSGIKINYSDDGSNFYIQNKKSNKYISFSINDNYAVTDQNKVYETEVPMYYGIRYVPLRIVCSGVGIGCDSYNDGNNKIYAIKIYTVRGLSAKELVRIHAPQIYSPSVPETQKPEQTQQPSEKDNTTNITSTPETIKPGDTSEDSDNKQEDPTGDKNEEDTQGNSSGNDGTKPNTDTSTVKPQQNTKPQPSTNKGGKDQNTSGKGNDTATQKPEDTRKPSEIQMSTVTRPAKPVPSEQKKEETVKTTYEPGTIMLFYGPENFENAERTLYTLSGQGVRSTFFVTEKDILSYPDVIRRIYASGNTIGIAFEEPAEELYLPGVLEERTKSTEDALYEITRTKTRIAYLPAPGDAQRSDIDKRANALGLCIVNINGDSATDKLDGESAGKLMAEKLTDIPEWFGADTAYIKMSHTDAGNAVVGVVADHARAHDDLKLGLFDETTK